MYAAVRAASECTKHENDQRITAYQLLLSKLSNKPLYHYVKRDVTRHYRHYEYCGTYTNHLINRLGRHPKPEEIIMLIAGVNHMGADCHVNTHYDSFKGTVYIEGSFW